MEYDELITRGNSFLKAGLLKQATGCFNQSVRSAQSSLQLAEAYHSLAAASLNQTDALSLLQYESIASQHYAEIDPGQSADFMKTAGGNLELLGAHELAKEAYRVASRYFDQQSFLEKDKDFQLAWKAWSSFCIAKTATQDASVLFAKAGSLFDRASKLSSGSIRESRTSNRYRCCALANLAAVDLEERLRIRRAAKNIQRAINLAPNNHKLKACDLSLKILIILLGRKSGRRFPPSEVKACRLMLYDLKKELRSIKHSDLLLSNIERTTEVIEKDFGNFNGLDLLNTSLSELIFVIC